MAPIPPPSLPLGNQQNSVLLSALRWAARPRGGVASWSCSARSVALAGAAPPLHTCVPAVHWWRTADPHRPTDQGRLCEARVPGAGEHLGAVGAQDSWAQTFPGTEFRTDAVTLPLARLRFCWSRPLPWVGMAVIPGLRAESRPTLGHGSPHLGTDPPTPPRCPLPSVSLRGMDSYPCCTLSSHTQEAQRTKPPGE